MLLRADATRAQRWGHTLRNIGDADILPIFYTIFGLFGTIMSITGGAYEWGEGNVLLGILLTIIVPILYVTPFILGLGANSAYIYAGRYTYNSDDRPADYRATEIFNKMNDDNKAIALPIVLKIYDLWPKKDANGDRLYLDACNQRVKVLKKILEEQVFTEKALANAEAKVQRSNAEVIDTDVAHALDYVESMRQVRKEFLSKHLEVTDG